QAQLNTSQQGIVSVFVWAQDVAGNIGGSGNDMISVDTAAPSISITSPTEDLTVRSTLDITFTGSDSVTAIVGTPSVSIDGTYTEAGIWSAPNGSLSIDTAGYADGLHTIMIRAIDSSGMAGYSASRRCYFDNTLPRISITATPDPAGSGSVVTLTLTASERLNTATASVSQSGTGTITVPLSLKSGYDTVWFGTYSVIGGFDGTAQVLATATDKAIPNGNVGTCSGSFVVDTTMPNGTVTINNGDVYTTSLNVSLGLQYATDTVALRVRNSGENWGDYLWETPVTVKTWRLSAGANGSRTVYMQLKDSAGNIATATMGEILYDATIPQATITIGSGNPTYITQGTATIYLEYDTPLEVGTVALSNDSVHWTVIATNTAPGSYTNWSLGGSDGTKWVYVSVTDMAGNVGKYSDSIILDTQGPGCSVLVNEDDLFTNNATVTLTISAYDPFSGVGSMSLSNNGATWSTWLAYQEGTMSWSLINGDGGTTTNGTRRVYVRFADGAGIVDGTTTDKIVYDNIAPSGTLTINHGANLTASRNVVLVMEYSDNSSQFGTSTLYGVQQVRYGTNGTDWTQWESSIGARSWQLADTQVEQTVWCEFRDACGNTQAKSGTITYDSLAPAGTITINSGATYTTSATATLTLEKGAAADTAWISNDGSNWTLCAFGTTTTTAWQLLPADGAKIVYFRVQDSTGNTAGYADWIVLDSTVPFGNVVINDGAVYATSTTLRLALSYNDVASGVAYARYRNDASGWGTWTLPVATTTYTLSSSAEGLRTVYYQIKDVLDHESDVYADTIILDTTQPRGTITINQGTAATSSKDVFLTLSYEDLINGSTTEGSGVDVVRFRNAGAGWGIWESPVTTKPWTLVPLSGMVGENRTVEFQMRDRAGLISATATATIILNDIAPLGTLTIKNGDAYTGTYAVGIHLDYVNMSGGAVRFSNERSSWSDWQTPFANGTWTLSIGDGVKLVYCQLKNSAGIVYECSDSIVMDTTAPFGTIVINNGAVYASSTAIVMSVGYNDLVSGVNKVQYTGAVSVGWGTPTAGTSAVLSSTDEGVKTVYFVMQDNAGNNGTATDTIIYDNYSPTGSITINNGAILTNDREVYLSLSYEDSMSGVDAISLREGTTTWGAWESAVTTKKLTLSDGDGVKTVCYRIRDKAGMVVLSEYSDSITLDTTAPYGTVSINNGSLTTASQSVVLYLDYAGSPALVRFSNDGQVWGSWNGVSGTSAWTLAADDGQRRVYAQLQDIAGNIGAYSDTILLDTTAPFGSVVIDQGNRYTNTRTVTLSLVYHDNTTGAADVGYYNNGAWSSWAAVTGDNATVTTQLTNTEGEQYVYYKIRDNAGIVSGTYSDTIILDTTPPSGTLTINTGAAYTTSRDVILSLEYSSDVNFVRYHEGGTPTTQMWEYISAARPMMLSSGEGTKTVYAQIKDYAGNTSVIRGTITMTTAESGILIKNGSPTTTSGSVTLNLIYNPNTTADVRYSNGGGTWTTWAAATPTVTSWQLTAGDGIKTVYYQTRDNEGNISEYSDSIILDTTKPFGSIVINDGTQYTATTSITLEFTAADSMSGVEAVRYGETLGSWTGVVDEATYTLTASNGTKTVYYQLRDNAGIVSATYSDTIILDTVIPTGTITINQNAAYTSSLDVKLFLSWADDTAGIRFVRFRQGTESPTTDWSQWESSAGERVYTLGTGTDGTRTVYYQLQDYADNISGTFSDTIRLDRTGPSGSVSISAGNDYATSATMVINYTCPIDIEGIRFSVNDRVTWGTWTTPIGTTGTVALTFADGDGTKRIYYQLRDYKGDTIELTDTIVLDTQGPGCRILINEDDLYTNDGTVTLTISAYDSVSGVGSMSMSNDGSTWSTWQAYREGTTSWSMISGAGGTTTNGYRYIYVRFIDNAGNVKGTTSDRVVYDNTLPSGTLTINENAAYSTSRQVRLNIEASDNVSGVEQVCFGTNGTTLGQWEQITGMRIWSFTAEGTQTVCAMFKDKCGNTATVVSDTIVVDTVVPTITVSSPAASAVVNGTVSITFNINEAVVGTPSISIDGAVWTQVSQWSAAAGQGTYTWNTAGVSDDSHIFQIKAQDAAGNIGYSDSRLVVVGNVIMPVTIVTPLPNAVISGDTLVKAVSPNGTMRCEFEVGSGATTWSLTGTAGTRSVDTNSTDGWCGTWKTGSFTPDGTYTLRAYAFNGSGVEIGSDTIQVVIDNTAPIGSVSIASPIKGAATVTYNSSQQDITQVIFECGSSSGTYTIGLDTTQPFNISWNTVGMVDGTYAMVATARDRVGLSYATSTLCVVDNTSPVISITTPLVDAILRGTLAVTGSAVDMLTVSTLQVSIDNGTWTSLPYTWDTSQYTDGAHILRLKGTDSVGNVGYSETRLVSVDNTPPFGSIVINNNDACTDLATVTLTLEYYDSGSGVNQVQYMFNDTTWGGWGSPTATRTGEILQGDGTDTVRYQIRDNAGNMATFTDTIILDRTAPSGTVTINQGAAWTSSRFVTLSLEYTDEVGSVSTGIVGARYSNTGAFSGGWEQPNVVKEWQLPSVDGTKVVWYQIKDGAGNTFVATSSINLDEGLPSFISFTAPINGTVYRGTVSITAAANDTIDVGRMFAYRDAMRIGTGTADGAINYDWVTTMADDGNHTIFVRATDEVGNFVDSELRVITVDNTPPDSVVITSPVSGAMVSGTITIEAVGADAIGVARVEFYRNGTGTSFGSSTSSPWVLNVSTTGWAEGTNTLYARCIDRAGNSIDSTGVEVIIDTAGPTAGSVVINAGATYSTSGVLNISWTGFSDALSGIAGYYYGFGTTTSTAYYTEGTNGQLTTANQGSVTVYVWAKDRAGNHGASVSDDIFVDTNAPMPYIYAINGASVGATVLRGTVDAAFTVSGEGVDAIVGTPQISIDGTASWVSVTSWSLPLMRGTYTWNTTALTDGVHTVRIRAQDLAGNIGYSGVSSVEVDNIVGAVVTIIEPANNSHVSGSRTIRIIAGNDAARVDIGVGTNGTTWRNLETVASGMYTDSTPADGFTAIFNTGSFTTQIGDGLYMIKAIAYATGGVELGSTTNTGIEVDNIQPTGSVSVAGLVRGVATVTYTSSEQDIVGVVFEAGSGSGTHTIGVDSTQPFNINW
ncbi:hypothetical protein KKG56_12295, partial [bacterium]|nr:hypothetical protein [bacterium]